jgi:anaerobic magnesium-protoporphyrin IX monomethyl ester cyclase
LPVVIAGLKELKRTRPDLVTILGGIGASGAAREIMTAFPWIDVVVCGEGEDTLRELMDCLEAQRPPRDVSGLIYRDKDRVEANPARPRIRDLRRLGKLDFSPLDLDRYQLINVISSRGCPFPCTFCDVAPYWRRKSIARPLDFISSEIQSIKETMDTPPTFIFVDDTLTVDRRRTEELCRRLGPKGLNVEWACYARASDLDEQLLELMGGSGCRKVYLGLESGSDRILSAIRKGFDVETARRAAVLGKRFIRIVQTSFVWGFPFETWEDFYETLAMMAYLTTKGVSVKANVLTPLPFSSLFEELSETMVFLPDYSPQLHLAEYQLDSPMVDLIRRYSRIFPCFYLYSSPLLTAKYDVLRKMGLSPEHIWDLWVEAKGPVPIRESPVSRAAGDLRAEKTFLADR